MKVFFLFTVYCVFYIVFTCAGIRVLDGPLTDSMEAVAFNKHYQVNDVYSCRCQSPCPSPNCSKPPFLELGSASDRAKTFKTIPQMRCVAVCILNVSNLLKYAFCIFKLLQDTTQLSGIKFG